MSVPRKCWEKEINWLTHKSECDLCWLHEEGCVEGERLINEYEEARREYFKWLRD